MPKVLKTIFIFLFVYFIFHTIRDILQILNLYGNPISDMFRANHNWCRPICDFITLPQELIGIFLSFIVLKRNRAGMLGIIAVIAFILMLFGFLLP